MSASVLRALQVAAQRIEARVSVAAVGTPLANMGARGLGLVGRFGLTLYMARYFTLPDIGLFGLTVGLAGLAPPFLGLGLNFFLSRELVGRETQAAGTMIRDRLAVTVLMMVLFGALVMLAHLGGLLWLPAIAPLIGFIVVMETLGLDLHMSLISLRKPILANMLLFIRSAGWVFPLVGWGLIDPSVRTLAMVFNFWAAGLALSALALAVALRDWPIVEIARTPVDWSGMWRLTLGGWLIYLNDIGMAGSLYADRYVVERVLGLAQTGLYTLYWSLANGMHVLVTAAVIQVSMPQLVAAFRSSDVEWVEAMERQFLKTLLIAAPVGLAMIIIGEWGLPRFGITRLSGHPALFAVMLVGITMRLASDILQYGLYSRHLDRQLALINISGLFITILLNAVLLKLFGLIGGGVAMIAAPLALAAIRLATLRRAGAPIPFVHGLGTPGVRR